MNAGDPNSLLIAGTTRSDYVPDTGVVDMGFHWPLSVGELSGLWEQLFQELDGELSREIAPD